MDNFEGLHLVDCRRAAENAQSLQNILNTMVIPNDEHLKKMKSLAQLNDFKQKIEEQIAEEEIAINMT